MSKPAKDEAALIKFIGQIIFYFGGEEEFFMENAEAALTIIREQGWAVVPQTELDALRAENARLREALSFYVRIRAQPVELVKDFGNTAEAALEWKP
jgi:pyruvate-formate lyase-activating enzyme